MICLKVPEMRSFGFTDLVGANCFRRRCPAFKSALMALKYMLIIPEYLIYWLFTAE